MGDEEKSTSVRYVKFSGKGSDFNEWKIKTLSLARRKKFDTYLLEDGRLSTDKDVVDKYDTGNADAWDQLVLSLSGTAFSVIQEADGDAHEAWKLLLDKYDVSSVKQISLTDVTEEWNNSRLRSTRVDPDDWFTYLYRVNLNFKKIKEEYGKDDEQIKAHVLVNLPEEYEAIQTNLCMNPTYTYKDYRTHIRNHWLSRLGGKEMIEKGISEPFLGTRQDSTNSMGESALNTENKKGNFKFKCRKCGLYGHKAKNCTTDKKDYKKFTGKCNYCQKTGHKEAQCWAKKRGDPRTPGSNDNGNNSGSSANNVQFCEPCSDDVANMFAGNTYCNAVTGETNMTKKDSWLGDSGATTHITNDLAGMRNKRACEVNVTVSTGEVTTAKTVGDIVLKTQSGEKVKLLDVLYVPTLKRNLLSTNRFTEKGAVLMADNEKMQIRKDKFSITLPMRKEGGMKMYMMETTRVIDESSNNVDAERKTEDVGDSTMATLPKSMDINDAHGLCHLGEKLLRITFTALGIKLTGKLKACDGCC